MLKELHLYSELSGSEDDNVDFAVELLDGRIYSFTAYTPRNIARLMEEVYPHDLQWVECGNVIVKRIDESCLRAAVEKCLHLGIEKFGVLSEV